MPTRPKGKRSVCHDRPSLLAAVFHALEIGTWAAHIRVHICWPLASLCDSSPDRLGRFVHIIVRRVSV